MYATIDPLELSFRYGVHFEWNVRELNIEYLPSGNKLVSWTFRDDGPIHDGRQRHPDIHIPPVIVPPKVDMNAWKARLWRWLEDVKKWHKFIVNYGPVRLFAGTNELCDLTSDNLDALLLAEQADRFHWAHRYFNGTQFREQMRRLLMPGNVMQIG